MKVTLAMDLWLVVEPSGEAILTTPIMASPSKGASLPFPAKALATGKVTELAEGDVIEVVL